MNQIKFKTTSINLSKNTFNITYVVIPNQNDNSNTLWMLATQWLKVLNYDISHASSIINKHNLSKITVNDIKLNKTLLNYSNISEIGLQIRSSTALFDETAVKKLFSSSKQPMAQSVTISDLKMVFEQLNKTWICSQTDGNLDDNTTATTAIKRLHTELIESEQPLKKLKESPEIPTCKGLISHQSVMNSETEKTISKNTSQSEVFECINPKMIVEEKHMRFCEDLHTFVYIADGQTFWFLGTCVVKSLEYSDTDKAIRKYVNTENTTTIQSFHGVPPNWRDLIRTHNIQPSSKFINEAGLYQLIMKSKMPKAKEFQTWVTSDVLPSLRKTGHYSMQQASMHDAENLNTINRVIENKNAEWYKEKLQLLEKLQESSEIIQKASQLIQQKDTIIHEKDATIQEKDATIQEKDSTIEEKSGVIIRVQEKLIEVKPLVVTVPKVENKFHKLELYEILPQFEIINDDGLPVIIDKFKYGYCCSRVQDRSKEKYAPKSEEEPKLIFSIKCANAINAYNCVKEYFKTVSKDDYKMHGKRLYCNIPPQFIIMIFEKMLNSIAL